MKSEVHIDLNEFSDLVREYASYKRNIQGRSKKTVDEYLLDLRTFFRYLKARENGIPFESDAFYEQNISDIGLNQIKKITSLDIYDFLDFVGAVRDNQTAARSRKLSSLRSFYKFLVNKRHYLEDNPLADIESPKMKKSLPKVLSLDESLDLLSVVQNDTESKHRLRDFCILTLFLNCGMRVSELAGIELGDVDRNYESLRVLGKGNKERTIYLNSSCREALANYLENDRLLPEKKDLKDKSLFLSNRNNGMSVKTVQAMVYKYLMMAGLGGKHYSVHKLRHTAATLMYQSGKVDVRILKEILGHEQLNTTQIYTHVTSEAIESAMSENPLDKIARAKKGEFDNDEV